MIALIRRRRILGVLQVAVLAVFLLAGCGEAANTGDNYVLTVTASRSSGTGNLDITIEDEFAVAVLASVAAAPTPAGVSYTGTVDFSLPFTASVSVTGLAMGAGETMTVAITYTENSYNPPVTRTIDSHTVTNTGAAGSNVTSTKPFALPLD
jgi:NAD(P)H-hydrate repair Nnr-like enzyme with NAD(P)H-hydrate dehydratase domain